MKRLPCSDSSNNLIIAFFVYLNPSTAHCTACLQEPTVVQLPQSLHFVQRFSFHPQPNIHPQTHSLALLSSSLSQCIVVQSCPISSCPQRQLIVRARSIASHYVYCHGQGQGQSLSKILPFHTA